MREIINGVPYISYGGRRSLWYRKKRAYYDPFKKEPASAEFLEQIAREVEAARLPDLVDSLGEPRGSRREKAAEADRGEVL